MFEHDAVVPAVQHDASEPAHEQEEQVVSESGHPVPPGARASHRSGAAR